MADRAEGSGYNGLMSGETECSVRVGPAGWAYDDWKGIVYPAGMPRSLHPLSVLCPLFDTIEVNSTFYRHPNPRYCASWIEKVSENPRFQFTVKLWQGFTHKRGSWPAPEEATAFKEGVAPLVEAGKLGAILLQFPWSFRRTPANRRWLGKIVDTFEGYPLALEVRHASWDCPELYEGLEERGVAFCNIDQPLFEDSIAPSARVSAPLGYVRFHGRNHAAWFRQDAGRNERYNYLYNEEELAPWVERVKEMKKKVNDLFIVTNNHYRGQAVVNALEIQATLGHGKKALPGELVGAYPRLKRLLREE